MAELSEQDIRQLAEEAIRQLGRSATPEIIEGVVKQAMNRLEQRSETPSLKPTPSVPSSRDRVIITAFGKNKPGILAGLTGVLASCNCDILDLSQKILQDFFTIMLLVDIAGSNADFETVKNDITTRGEELDLKVIVQHEEIFNAMHRI